MARGATSREVRVGPAPPASGPGPGWHYPAWSPAGDRLLVAEAENNFIHRLSTVALDGSGLSAVTGPATTRTASPVHQRWSPDGGRIAFTTLSGNWYIAVSIKEVAGGAPTNLTEWPRTARTPAWAPDGNALAFHSLGDIYVATLDGGIVNLTRSAGFREFTPDWTQ